MTRDTRLQGDDLLQFEKRLLSLFEDPDEETRVMANSQRRLREVMANEGRPSRPWGSNTLGLLAVAAAGFAIAVVTAAVHSGLIHLASTAASTTKSKTTVNFFLAPENACRLPVWMQDLGTGGFVAVPNGTYIPDAGSAAAALPGRTYDDALHRWVPPANQLPQVFSYGISPDGRTAVYVAAWPKGTIPSTTSILRVDLFGGQADRVIWTGRGEAALIGYSELGVVFEVTPSNGGTPTNWLLNPDDGSTRQLPGPISGIDAYSWYRASGGALWGTRMSARTSSIVRLDLNTGAVDVWLDSQQFGAGSPYGFAGESPLGFDAGHHPVFRFGSRDPGTPYSVVLLAAPGKPVVVYAGRAGDTTDFDPTNAIGDSHGTWFGNMDGSAIWLYRSGTLQKKPVTGRPQDPRYKSPIGLPGGPTMTLAGPCQ